MLTIFEDISVISVISSLRCLQNSHTIIIRRAASWISSCVGRELIIRSSSPSYFLVILNTYCIVLFEEPYFHKENKYYLC